MTTRAYITAQDVEDLLGVKRTKASEIIRGINDYAVKNGYSAFPCGKANKYMFAERYGIPLDVLNAQLTLRKEVRDGPVQETA